MPDPVGIPKCFPWGRKPQGTRNFFPEPGLVWSGTTTPLGMPRTSMSLPVKGLNT